MTEEQKKNMKALWSGVAKGAFLLVQMVSGKMGLFCIAQKEDACAAMTVGNKHLTKAQEISYLKLFKERLGKMIDKLESDPNLEAGCDDAIYMHDTDTGEIVPHPDLQVDDPEEGDKPDIAGRWN